MSLISWFRLLQFISFWKKFKPLKDSGVGGVFDMGVSTEGRVVFATIILWSERYSSSARMSTSVISSSLLVRMRSRMFLWRVGRSTNCVRKSSFIKLTNRLWVEDSVCLFEASPCNQFIPGKLKSPVIIMFGHTEKLFAVSLRASRTSAKFSVVESGERYTFISRISSLLIYRHWYSIRPIDPEVSSCAVIARLSLR